MHYTWPSPEQLAAVSERVDDSRPITMLNLLRYRDQADYTDHPGESPCSGKDAYARYAKQAVACVESFGGRLVFNGAAGAMVIGPVDEHWDDVLLVEYPSARAFLDMASSERYHGFAYHRQAAIEDSRLVLLHAGESAYLS